MTEKDWNQLRQGLLDGGYAVGDLPESGEDFHASLARDNEVAQDVALEWLAGVYQILPLDPTRTACSTRAEAIFRNMAVPCDEEEPWVPLGNAGPLLICAHYNPASTSYWSIPFVFIIPVLIPQAKYDALKADLQERLNIKPLEEREAIRLSGPPPRREGLKKVVDWVLKEYPFDEQEMRLKLEHEREAMESATPADLLSALKNFPKDLGLAFYRLCSCEPCFNADYAPPQNIFPEVLLEKHGVFPMYCGRKIVYLLSSQKNNYAFEDEWLSSGNDAYDFRTVYSDRETILAVINRERGRTASAATVTQQGELTYSDSATLVDIDVQEVQRINPTSINATPEQVIHWVLWRAITGRGSDLHIEKYYNTARFRARIDGEMKVIHSCGEEMLPRFISLIKNYANMGQRRQDAQDARFSLILGKRRVDCRISAIPCRKDLQKLTIRFLDKQDGIKKLSELRLSPRQDTLLSDAMGRDQGLILVTGPTGSGKTTTLYALLNSINSENINIHTIEDPIEYELEGMNQTQADPLNNLGFAEGLRRLMRADPDVILIGECRDEETASAAINAALTGHLVLTTLHANDCLRAVTRLIAMGVPPYMLADSLALTQAQRLARRLCQFCKKPTELTPDLRRLFRNNHIPIRPDQTHIYSRGGCQECGEGGYTGRLALMELCASDNTLADLISRNAPLGEMRRVGFQNGMLTLYQEGLNQVLAGMTSLEEISCLSYTAVDVDIPDNAVSLNFEDPPPSPPPSVALEESA